MFFSSTTNKIYPKILLTAGWCCWLGNTAVTPDRRWLCNFVELVMKFGWGHDEKKCSGFQNLHPRRTASQDRVTEGEMVCAKWANARSWVALLRLASSVATRMAAHPGRETSWHSRAETRSTQRAPVCCCTQPGHKMELCHGDLTTLVSFLFL